jgi:hypothetical protein
LTLTDNGFVVGNVLLTNLPFTAGSNSMGIAGSGVIRPFINFNGVAGEIFLVVNEGTTNASFINGGAASSSVAGSDRITNTASFNFTIIYEAAN